MNHSKYFENRLIQSASNGDIEELHELLIKMGDNNISSEMTDRLIYYSARNGHIEYCEYMLSKYGLIHSEKLDFGYRDSCKRIANLIYKINDVDAPNLYLLKNDIIKDYLRLSQSKGHHKNFSNIILEIEETELRDETFDKYFKEFSKQDTETKKKFYNELLIVYRNNSLESLLAED